MCQLGWVNQASCTDDHLTRGIDLVHAILGEFKLGDTSVSAVLGPFGLAWFVRWEYGVIR
jgi:hypothetical protein